MKNSIRLVLKICDASGNSAQLLLKNQSGEVLASRDLTPDELTPFITAAEKLRSLEK